MRPGHLECGYDKKQAGHEGNARKQPEKGQQEQDRAKGPVTQALNQPAERNARCHIGQQFVQNDRGGDVRRVLQSHPGSLTLLAITPFFALFWLALRA